ncbi:MAG TPA: sugar phosphate isomerase/epimerase [Methanocorpusculum sp.]|nr:sugar phosphate isomerase/epimerase [Methanocorpusculum sp.]HJK81103.1 sugar phosphate isomerase/epimerase [Methanocorpusculum sp.]
MKIYFASSRLSLKDPESWVAGIAQAGFDGWEISMDGWFHSVADIPRKFPGIRKVLRDTGLESSVHLPFSGLNPASLNADVWNATVSQLSACIESASEIADTITLHPGYLEPNGREATSAAWNTHKEALARLGEVAERAGVCVALENMPNLEDFYCRDPYELEGFADAVSGISLTFDVGHANTNGNLDAFCRVILPRAAHLHIHDNHGKYDEHLPLGKGSIDWKKIMPKIQAEYHGKIMVVEGRNPAEGRISLDLIREWF